MTLAKRESARRRLLVGALGVAVIAGFVFGVSVVKTLINGGTADHAFTVGRDALLFFGIPGAIAMAIWAGTLREAESRDDAKAKGDE